MPPALLPLLLFAPTIGASGPGNTIVAPHRATADRTVQQRQDDGFVIVDGDLAPAAPAAITTVRLGTHVALDRSLIDGRASPCGGAGR